MADRGLGEFCRNFSGDEIAACKLRLRNLQPAPGRNFGYAEIMAGVSNGRTVRVGKPYRLD